MQSSASVGKMGGDDEQDEKDDGYDEKVINNATKILHLAFINCSILIGLQFQDACSTQYVKCHLTILYVR